MPARITFNGKEYERPEDMPPAIRDAYDRAMSTIKGSPASGSFSPKVNIKVSTNVRFVHDGKTYNSLDEMPLAVREHYQKAMDQIDTDHNGVPDFLESQPATAVDDPFRSAESPIAPIAPQPPVIVAERASNRLLVMALGIIVLLLLVVAGLAVYIFAH